jgi:putative heme-binding domain-containing protein
LVKTFGPFEHASCYAYFRLESGSRQRINLLVGSDDGIRIWQNGREVWTNDTSRAALPYQDVVVLELEPGSNDILIRVRNLTGSSGLYTHYRTLASAAHVLPEKLNVESLAERLKSAGGDKPGSVPAEFLSVDWPKAARDGNAEQGKKLFEAAGCAKCHALTNDAALTGGPSLAEAARRFTVPYLVESILLPSKQVSPVFKASAIVTKAGQQFTGLVVGETAEKLDLLQADTRRITIDKSEIDQRQLLDLSPMPQGVLKKPDELRDLLAFLLNEKP